MARIIARLSSRGHPSRRRGTVRKFLSHKCEIASGEYDGADRTTDNLTAAFERRQR